ncbi:hypothetical protein HGRIS_008736 [Hohenbuehelia grisea]
MAFNPNIEMEGLPGLRKHFTPTLSPAIAPLKTPHFEGSGGLYFRLSSDKDDKRVVLLTCAHVSHPPPAFENKVYTRKKESQPREDVILLGSGAFDNAVQSIMGFIGDQTVSITTWEFSLARLPEEVPNEPRSTASRRKELTNLIETAKDKIEEANTLHTYITKNFTTTASRVFGFVLHVAKIEVGADNVLYDWSFIQVDEDKIDWDEFKGNMVFVGGNKTDADWKNYMFPQSHDARGYNTPNDLLLEIKGFVPESEFRNPQNYDIHNVKTLLAVKNGRTTNTTYGRVNGLESITRNYPEHGIRQDAVEYIVCGYDTVTAKNDRFSDKGDSGAWAFTRDGRAIGQITGGGGPSDKTDKTYITAGHKIKAAIDAVFPGSSSPFPPKRHLVPRLRVHTVFSLIAPPFSPSLPVVFPLFSSCLFTVCFFFSLFFYFLVRCRHRRHVHRSGISRVAYFRHTEIKQTAVKVKVRIKSGHCRRLFQKSELCVGGDDGMN